MHAVLAMSILIRKNEQGTRQSLMACDCSAPLNALATLSMSLVELAKIIAEMINMVRLRLPPHQGPKISIDPVRCKRPKFR